MPIYTHSVISQTLACLLHSGHWLRRLAHMWLHRCHFLTLLSPRAFLTDIGVAGNSQSMPSCKGS